MKFSIVVPCYKSSKSIAACLGSIKDQDFKDYELICVFDGEDKPSQLIAKSMGARVEVLPHGGAQKARNHGLKLAKGDFTIFCDCDVFWDAGAFRSHKDKLDETGADFSYSGYRWDDGQVAHIPPEFDVDMLKVCNYIDSSNPVRTSIARLAGGWDESINRFQDWDFFLRVVKVGGVGVKLMEDTVFSTFRSGPENISGKYGYKESYDIVIKKHGIVRSDVIITSLAAKHHAQRIAKLCGWDYWVDPRMIPHKYKAVYVLGMFPESIEPHIQLLKSQDKAKMLVHWIGTDVLHMHTMIPYINSKFLRISFDKTGVKNFVQSEANKKEMEELGFTVENLPLPVESTYEQTPLPEQFTVACYDHEGIDEKWHKWLVIELVKAMPDVKFLFYGNKNACGVLNNAEWVGRKPIAEVIKRSSCLLRLTPHDGFPVACVEFLCSGRKVITNVEEVKYATQAKIGVVNHDTIPEIKQRLYSALREIQHNQKIENQTEVTEYYRDLLSPDKFKKRIEEVING
jgi:glycosyltransferase involved in cell wall biosynthesis